MNPSRAVSLAPPSVGGTAAIVLIADVSASMRGRKYDRLKASIRDMVNRKALLLAFSWRTWWCETADDMPRPEGDTDLAAALLVAAEKFPAKVIVLSDGVPNDEQAALRAADRIPGVISCAFVGDDDDRAGMEFMRKLARVGGGDVIHRDLGKIASIEADVRAMLALDAPIAL